MVSIWEAWSWRADVITTTRRAVANHANTTPRVVQLHKPARQAQVKNFLFVNKANGHTSTMQHQSNPKRRDVGYSTASLSDANLVTKQNFCCRSLPSSIASRRDHEAASRVEIQLRYDSSTVAWYNQKRYCCALGATLLLLLLT
jgi:hypothetical protein